MIRFQKVILFGFPVLLSLISCGTSTNDLVSQTPTPTPLLSSGMPPAATIDRKWKPATYRGLRMGTATIDDLTKVLERPSITASLPKIKGKERIRHVFDKIEKPALGQLAAWVEKRNVIHEIEFAPESLRRKDLQGLFGSDYQITKYAQDDCVEAPFDATAVYESPEGQFSYIEYRENGLAIAMNEPREDPGEDTVAFILYLSEPIGPTKSQCK